MSAATCERTAVISRLPGQVARSAWVWPAAVMSAVGSVGIGRPEIWRDELATWSAATRSVPELLRMSNSLDGVYLPYYLFMKGWIALFGDSVIVLRVPALLAAAGAAALVALIGRRLAGPPAGLLAGLVLALLPAMSRMAQEARPYAPVVCATALATLALLHALERMSWAGWLRYGGALVLVGLCHLVALAVLAGHLAVVVFMWWRRRDARVVRCVVAVLLALAVLSPLLVLGLRQQGRQIAWVRPATLGTLVGIDDRFAQGTWVGAQVFYSGPAAALVLLLAAAAWMLPGRRRIAAILTGFALLPVLAVWCLSFTGTSYFVPRYLIFTLVPWALLAGVTLAAIRWRTVTTVMVLAVAAVGLGNQIDLRKVGAHDDLLYPAVNPLSNHPASWTAYDQAAAVIDAGRKPGDAVAYGGRGMWLTDTGLRYHLGDRLPPDVFVNRTAAELGELNASECADYAARLGESPPARIWMVTVGENSHAFTSDPVKKEPPMPETKITALRAHYETGRTWSLPGLTVTLLKLRQVP
ncbi:glycosyltransferase family 39 protein [Streptomyces sp. NPDC055709]